MALSPGTRLGPYEILGAAGAGGMGEVYRARDTRLDRTVAIKVLPGSLSSNCDFRARFKQEAKAISSLSHTHICTLYDIGEQDGIDYLVLEYLEGATLSDRLMRSKMENSEILRIGIQVADALKAAHAKGIVHRDIKPANVFLTKDGEVKVLDFGVARMGALLANASNEATSMTIAGETMGTVAYMSPEQARGKVTDARSDLFSLGAVIYEMATGARPFPGDTTAEVFDGILNKMPVPISRISPITPVELDRIVTKALEKDPDLRFQSAADLASELKRLNRDASSSAVVTPAVAGKSRTGAWVGIGVVLIAVVAGAVWWMMRDRSGSTAGSGGQVTVAVLPFQNMGAGSDMDFMRVALADEITTALSYAPQLAIRPSSSVRKYLEGDVDPQKAGKELRVTNLVTGHFLKNRDDLQVTLEAINVENNLVVWRETSSFPMSDMKSLQERVLARVRQGLLPMLGVSSTSGPKTEAHNEEAYNLYLKALAMPHDPGPNQQAIALLEKSVALESTYAPAWAWLGQRYDYAATYEGGGRAMQDKCKEALERAVRLDPNLLWAAGGLVQLLSDRGELEPALAQAQEFVKAHPDVAEAHFSLSYVLRYTGMLDRSQKECATVLKLDPTNYRWRSCAQAFCSANDYEGAEPYLALDAGSWWVRRVREQILLKQGRRSEAMAMANDQSDAWARFESASLRGAPSSEVEKLAEDYEAWLMKINDSEMLYNGAAYLAYGNQRAAALRVLKSAVDGNYCQYPAMDNDPMLANIRNTPEYAALRDKAKACHERMVALAK